MSLGLLWINLICELNACGSDWGTPGGDHTNWNSISQALMKIGYKEDANICGQNLVAAEFMI